MYIPCTQWDGYVPPKSTCCPQGTARLLLFFHFMNTLINILCLVSLFYFPIFRSADCCRYRRKNPMWQNAAACIWTSPTATVNKDQSSLLAHSLVFCYISKKQTRERCPKNSTHAATDIVQPCICIATCMLNMI